MKLGVILKHYLPCLYFIFLALCIAYSTYNSPAFDAVGMRNNIITALVMLALFLGLLFVRRTYARMIAGLLMLFLSLYFSLSWFDEMVDIGQAGGAPSPALRNAIYYIAGAFCMAILLIVPLHLPQRTPLYNRK